MFSGELVILSAVRREHLPRYVEWLSNWEIGRTLSSKLPHPLTIQDEEEWFDRQRKDQNARHFAILTLADGQLIGGCGLEGIDWASRHAEFGIFIGDKGYWNKGYGSDATRTLLRYAFQEAGLHRIELEVYAFNAQALRLYEGSSDHLEDCTCPQP